MIFYIIICILENFDFLERMLRKENKKLLKLNVMC